MNMKLSRIIICCLVALAVMSCASSKKSSYYSTYQSPTTYMNDEGDGSLTVRAYGLGRNRSDAMEQAAKNAVRDVIFKGVSVPGNALLSKPLVTTVNAEEKFQDFFNPFFADGGTYKQFVSRKDHRPLSNKRERSSMQVKLAITLRVLRADLRNYLMENKIIEP